MATRRRRADLKKVRTISIAGRPSKIRPRDFAVPFDPSRDSFSAFTAGLPSILKVADLRRLVRDMVRARRAGRPVILMMGAHVIKVGLGPVIVDLVRLKALTAVAMNSAAAIHDVEIAMWGKTSEDVAAHLLTGRFGMARETGEFINGTLRLGRRADLGYGEALGGELLRRRAPNASVSVLAECRRMNVPVTVHAAIGTDIVHQQPTMDGGITGEMSFRDFRALCSLCADLSRGAVVLNVGSAVIMPEVFLKALTVARNLGAGAKGFTTAVFDMNVHYRPTMNVQTRPTLGGGTGLAFVGHHEIMIPLLAAMVKQEIR